MRQPHSEPSCPIRECAYEVKAHMPEDDRLYDLAELFKVFGDTTRVKILWALLHAELCVCEIAEVVEMKSSAISHQLRILRQARLVRHRREGKTIFYALDDAHIKMIFDQGLEHVLESYTQGR